MSDKNSSEKFTASHHAYLFSYLSKSIVDSIGFDKGEKLMRQAVRQYGEERGKRMAMRAEANGHPLTMFNYIAYSEWKASPGEMKQKIVKRSVHTTVDVKVCPWHSSWESSGMIPYGRFFCLEIDKALVFGFNPDLQLDVGGIHTYGASSCEFVFHDADLSLPRLALLIYKKKVHPGKKALMSWEYHLGHLYKTIYAVVSAEFGNLGESAINSGFEEFAEHFGKPAAAVVLSYLDTDFFRNRFSSSNRNSQLLI